MTLHGSTVTFNTGQVGGGIYNDGTMTLKHTTVAGNSATYGGAGIDNFGTVTLKDSTVSDNRDAIFGGGIDNYGTLTLRDSTVTLNTAQFGGGIDNNSGSAVTVQTSTVDCNIPDDIAGPYTEKNSRIGGCT